MLSFAKYHGLGNDFILVAGLSSSVSNISPDQARQLCDRHFGVGADGVITVRPSAVADCRMKLLNSDGSEADMCGNGLRCLAQFVWDEGLVHKTEMAVETLAGIKRPYLHVNGERVIEISAEIGQPQLAARAVPTTLVAPDAQAIDMPLELEGATWRVTALNTGVPHCVVFVPDLDAVDWRALGPRIERHPAFPRKTNVMFTQVMARDRLRVRPWERGAGPTLACGTGACAAAAAGVLAHQTERRVQVELPGGVLRIEWEESSGEMIMTGPATRVFAGQV